LSFIPLAEDNGLIVPLGLQVLRTACRQMKVWLDAGIALDSLSVNLSVRQFASSDLVADVAAALAETGCPPSALELELTESALMEQGDVAIKTLGDLKALGVRLAIDDFGTGYSSFAYLKRFRVDKLKIDRCFIKEIPDDAGDMEIAAAIVAMSRSLGLSVLAEGVETNAQLDFLRSGACDFYQGYLCSPPVPAAEFVRLLDACP
jgi:EAL domain-containing protein (putative c-di-GMP-specific phosphodiesterase class I)